MHTQPKSRRSVSILTCLFLLLTVCLLIAPVSGAYAQPAGPRSIDGQMPAGMYNQIKPASYSDVLAALENDYRSIDHVKVSTRNGNAVSVTVKKTDGIGLRSAFPGQRAAEAFLAKASSLNVEVRASELPQSTQYSPSSNRSSGGSGMGGLLPIFILLAGMFGISYYFNQKNNPNAGGQQKNNFQKSTAKKFEAESAVNQKTFKDVAGQDEAKEELNELVGFLKNRRLLDILGGKPAKGVLMVGPPGTGKTLLARAVAGEAGADFFSISGSEFVQMFVGVGAARVRDLFEQASKSKAAIIFIDEIDAVGRQRGTGMGGGNDEREQTLNQLLVEMDGFKSSSNIIVIAATNRADVLDPALLRPGRFDMQVLVDNPDLVGRHEILKVHTRGKPLHTDVDLMLVAKNTTGMSGAQLEGVANQAATIAFRRIMGISEEMSASGVSNEEIENTVEVLITMDDIDEGIDRVLMGPKNGSRNSRMSAEDKKNTAIHEVGHAWIADLAYKQGFTKDPVTKITIVPRARALGYMVAQPEAESYSQATEYLMSRIMIAMGGRAAQEVFLGVSDGGAQNDFEQSWNIANRMVTKFGMSRLGIISIGQGSNPFLGRSMAMGGTEASPALQAEIDDEIRRILAECYEETKRVIARDKDAMQPIIDRIIETETILGPEFGELIAA